MTITRCVIVCLLVALLPRAWCQKSSKPIYRDENAPIAGRVRDTLSRMTVEEKVAQLESGWMLPLHPTDARMEKVAGHGLGTYVFIDEFLGAGSAGNPRDGARRRNELQSWVLKNTRLGIPILFHEETLHGAVRLGATVFPEAANLGSTWDPELLQKMFSTVALEARASGNALVLAPVLDLSRAPRFGRVEEMYSEDPYLVAQLGIAAVKGLQGTDNRLDESHVFATAKHFLHARPENRTNVGPSDFSERTTRSIFLYPFEQVVKDAHIEAVMPSYNETSRGMPSNANPWLLKDVLRNEWGFTGLTVSDYVAVGQLAFLQHVAEDSAATGVLAFKSGVDMELPSPVGFPAPVDAVTTGKIPERDLDEAVGRVLSAKFASRVAKMCADVDEMSGKKRPVGSVGVELPRQLPMFG